MKTLKMHKWMLALFAVSVGLSAQAGDKVNGQALIAKSSCTACHGADFKTPIAKEYPKLAGQHEDYLYHALLAYKTSNNPQVGRSNAIMSGQVAQFSNKELRDIAAFISAQPGDLVLKK